MEDIKLRTSGPLVEAQIRCILHQEVILTKLMVVLLEEAFLHRIHRLVLVLSGEAILHGDLLPVVGIHNLPTLLVVYPKVLPPEGALEADGICPRALLWGVILVAVGFHLILPQEVEYSLLKVPLVVALVEGGLIIKDSMFPLPQVNQESLFWPC